MLKLQINISIGGRLLFQGFDDDYYSKVFSLTK